LFACLWRGGERNEDELLDEMIKMPLKISSTCVGIFYLCLIGGGSIIVCLKEGWSNIIIIIAPHEK
jgi:hypothetical protein